MGVGIEVKNLNAWFGKAQILKEINITVGANVVTAVIGKWRMVANSSMFRIDLWWLGRMCW